MLNDEVLNAAEVAQILHIGRNAVYDLAKSGELPSYRMGRKILFALKDVDAYLARSKTGTPASDASSIDGQNGDALPKEGATAKNDAGDSGSPADDVYRIGGIGLPANLVVDRLNESGINALHATMNSYSALSGIYKQVCDGAVVHLFDQRTNSYNVPYVQRLAPGVPVVVFRMAKRWQGLVVAKRNPKKISTWGALLREDVRIANRARGCGSRVLLDEKLLSMEARPESVSGYDTTYPTALTAARAVSSGTADVAIAGEQVLAQISGVDFVRMQQECIDLVVAKSENRRKVVQQVREMLADPSFKGEFDRIVHGDTTDLGAIVYEC